VVERFEDFYRREHAHVFGSLTLILRDREGASDATDEAFSRAFERWSRVGVMESPGGWVYTTALNVARRRLRRASLERSLHLATPPAPAAPEGMRLDVWDAVCSLPTRQRTAVALYYLLDLAEHDVAALMGVSRGTVSSCLVAARRSLADALRDQPTPLRRANERMPT
jgi:RNA polymerase sigma-70 factor (ECF subfamily)